MTALLPPLKRVQLFVDFEFNGKFGEMISVGMVSPDEVYSFHEAIDLPIEEYEPWVLENVIPVLGKAPLPPGQFYRTVRKFLAQFSFVEFIFNAKADGRLLTDLLQKINAPLYRLRHERHLSAETSETPHNALADARAMIHHLYGTTARVPEDFVASDRDVMLALYRQGVWLDRRAITIWYARELGPKDSFVAVIRASDHAEIQGELIVPLEMIQQTA